MAWSPNSLKLLFPLLGEGDVAPGCEGARSVAERGEASVRLMPLTRCKGRCEAGNCDARRNRVLRGNAGRCVAPKVVSEQPT